jgi:hypothetical protein
MKLQCDLCREIVVADFAVAGDAIEVHCPSCSKQFRVGATRAAEVLDLKTAARRAPAPDEQAMTCPKCGDAQPAAPACRSCGLLATRMAEFERDRDVQVPADVTAAWTELDATWNDAEAHDRFIKIVAAAMAYPWAAKRYRDALRLRPDDRLAAEQLARLAKMAEATLFATATRKATDKPKPYRGALVLLAAMTLLIFVGLAYAVLSRGLSDDPGGAPSQKAPRPAPKAPAKPGPKTPR